MLFRPTRKSGSRVGAIRKLGTPDQDTLKTQAYVDVQRSDDTGDSRVIASYLKGGFISKIPDQLVSSIVDNIQGDPNRTTVLFFQHCGGAASRQAENATAFAQRDSIANMMAVAAWRQGTIDPTEHIQASRKYWGTLEPFTRGFYVNDLAREVNRERHQRQLSRQLPAAGIDQEEIRSDEPVPIERERPAGVMKQLFPILLLSIFALGFFGIAAAAERPRVFVLTDIENEPDDAMSMVRFLVYANQWDVEGLAATTSVHQKNKVAAWRIREIVDAYAKVRDNLELHEPGFPSADALRAVIVEGRPDFGMAAVGKGMDSAASELLIKAVDRKDARPLWVPVWGGPNVLAQALWKVRATRSAKELQRFVAKLRVYTISDQDDSGAWIRKTFPELFYIASPGVHAGGAYHYSTWSGISGDKFHGRFAGADFSIVDNPWLDEHIRAKGPLGAQHPHTKFMMEGDTPSFLNLIGNGLSDPEHPDWGGWGGRYEFYTPRMRKWFHEPETRPFWSDAEDEVLGVDGNWHTSNQATIWRWRSAFQNDFAARMDWTIKPYADGESPTGRPPRAFRSAHRQAR